MSDQKKEIEFKAINPNDLDVEKAKLLQMEKQGAIEEAMIKFASVDIKYQDPYPSPFFNLSDTQIPRTPQEIFKWCKYYYTFDPLIAGAINALATFPVTPIVLEDKKSIVLEDKKSKKDKESDLLKLYKKVLFKNLNIYKLLIEIGIDYFLYGNCFVFGEMRENPQTKEIEWKTMVRLDPSRIIIDYNPATQHKVYKWQVPDRITEIVKKKKPKEEYEAIPDIIKQAVLSKKAIVLNPDNIYHFARPADSMGESGVWGVPIVANVLKLLMYRNILRQAQEAIAREHIVPLRIYYLEKTQDYNPMADYNAVAEAFAEQLKKAVRDPNHKIVSPIPVNVLNLGGQGRALLLTPEIQQIQDEILAGMNVPREFIFGGISYSGSSISLRILENQFITYRLLLEDFLQNFVIKNMAKARKEWLSEKDDDELITVKLMDLKMQDDVQQKQLIIELNASGKCTNEYLWKVIGIDADKMKQALLEEALQNLEFEKELQKKKIENEFELRKYQLELEMQLQQYQQQLQMKLQNQTNAQTNINSQTQTAHATGNEQSPQSLIQSETEQQTPLSENQEVQNQSEQQNTENTENNDEELIELQGIALQLLKLPKSHRLQVISTLPQSVQQKVVQLMQQFEIQQDRQERSQIDMRPLPEKLPPRRKSLN